MVVWTNPDGTVIEWPDEAVRPAKSDRGGKAASVSAPRIGHAQFLKQGAQGELKFDHPVEFETPAVITDLQVSNSSFGAMLVAHIEF